MQRRLSTPPSSWTIATLKLRAVPHARPHRVGTDLCKAQWLEVEIVELWFVSKKPLDGVAYVARPRVREDTNRRCIGSARLRDDMHAVRALVFFLTGFSPMIPVAHILLFLDTNDLQDFHLFWWILGCLFYTIGAALYAT